MSSCFVPISGRGLQADQCRFFFPWPEQPCPAALYCSSIVRALRACIFRYQVYCENTCRVALRRRLPSDFWIRNNLLGVQSINPPRDANRNPTHHASDNLNSFREKTGCLRTTHGSCLTICMSTCDPSPVRIARALCAWSGCARIPVGMAALGSPCSPRPAST